ncbi:Hsp70 family protein [Saccharopolyspora phatthalungensis]|uniref:Molecular chaperone DnaK (HSP70) n=1 Tax=Saccharopolyspora phatthalungensis TaxID=664693 RepID=A0A840Q313_9PSEU|nr:Hsp70 family protein [Saccharopolyspora phatthalungensis]MBB5153138.1 molecular chaperone DnaK (HSP70) [Saccharopolyspora phatthalungensis]
MAPATFGIDLGTTHSCIAHIDEAARPVIAKSAVGEDTTPSVVYFERPGVALVGTAAKNSALLAPHLVAQLVKRDMGRKNTEFTYHGNRYTPEKISALILRELARAAEENTGHTVRDVVITVPAYFGIAERDATRKAGEIAGLNVLDVLDEPVAAALHHHALDNSPQTRHVLVYDLGGGTFDTSVIRVTGDDIQVVCTDGDGELGGADWDERIVDHLLAAFREEHPELDPSADEHAMQEFADRAEDVKKALSATMSRNVALRIRGAAATVPFTRQQLEELTADLLDRTMAITERIIETARRKGVERFDEVLLAGGMTRMPAVAAGLRQRFGLDARLSEPDLAVAKGAALFALIRQANKVRDGSAGQQLGISAADVDAMAKKRVATVVPRAFGVKALDPRDPLALTDPMRARQMVAHLLQANTELPADTGPYPFQTAIDNQRMAEIEVWEQAGPTPSDDPADNTKVGHAMLTGIPARPAGCRIEITFTMSETGALTVHAKELESGNDVRFELSIGGMDHKAVARARTDIAGHQVSG